jgi:hypothetical protein|nr:hypothetical protein [Rhodospirillales bacterium]
MAFKALDKTELLGVASIDDPAIDSEMSDIEEYKGSHDMKHLVFIKDEQPSIFNLGVISYMTFTGIKDKHITFELGDNGEEIKTNLFGLAADALRYGLKSVENLPFDLKIERGRLSNSTMDKLARLGVVEELGNIVLTLNGFGDDDKKK